jgi:subtilisin family serine protease
MSKNLWATATAALLLLCSAQLYAQTYKPGVIRVKFKDPYAQTVVVDNGGRQKTGITAVDKLNEEVGVTSIKRIFREAGKFEKAHRAYGLHLWYEITFDESNNLRNVISKYKNLAYFEIVEPFEEYYIIKPEISETNVPKPSSISGATNDPLFNNQWHYQNTGQTGGTPGADIQLPQAWSIQTGSQQIVVAVIDGGIDILHPDLSASMWINTNEIPDNGIDDDNNGYVDDVYGYGFGDNTGTIYPNFHGTHVAGTIAAVTNNELGVSGIAGGSGTGNGVRLMSCAGFGSWGTGGFEAAMVYAADNGAVISQNSWGGGSSAIEAAIDYFIARAGYDNTEENFSQNIQIGPMAGGIVIFAAGNSNSTFGYPASYPPVMAVAATDHNDQRASFSTFGDWVDIAGPGVNVLSTYPIDLGSYSLLSGTSMACPHVSGVAALVISEFGGDSFYPNQVWDRLLYTSDNIDHLNPGYEGLLGTGRLNAFHALQAANDIPPDPITDLISKSNRLNSIVLQWTTTGASGSEGAASFYDLRYSSTPLTEENFASATRVTKMPRPLLSGAVQEFEVTDLAHSTVYYFAIKAGDFFGNISGLSNVINSETLEPPIIGISPTFLTEDLITGGKSTQYISVSNTGNSDLYVSAQSSVSGSPVIGSSTMTRGEFSLQSQLTPRPAKPNRYPTNGVLKKNILREFNSSPKPNSEGAGKLFSLDHWTNSIIELNVQTGDVINSIPAPEGFSDGPDGLTYDGKYLYFISAWASNSIYRIDATTGEVISNLLLPGIGEIDALGSSTQYIYALSYGTGQIFEIDYDQGEIVRTITPGLSIGGGLTFGGSRGTLFVSNFNSAIYEIDLSTGGVINSFTPSGSIYGMGYSEGAGVLFVSNVSVGSIQAIDPDNGTVKFTFPGYWSSALASDEAGASWLSIDKNTITVAPGLSFDLPVNFDATGLIGGVYTGEVTVKSNDPVTTQVNIPVTLNVTGAPDIHVKTEAIDFGECFVEIATDTLFTIENKGTDILNVEAIAVSHAAFSINPLEPFSLNPGQVKLLTVTFHPISTGTYFGVLQINSNDPDETVLEISLNGTAVTPPIIQVSPSSIEADLFTGEKVEKTLTILNTGGSNLIWNISLVAGDSQNLSGVYYEPLVNSSLGINNLQSGVTSEISGGPFLLASGDFIAKSSSPVPLTCVAVSPSGFIYAQANEGYAFYRYNPASNTWSELASSPLYSGNNGGAAYLNGKIYTIYTHNSGSIGVYDIPTNTWSTITNGLGDGTGNIASDGTFLYLVVYNQFKRYSPETNTWTTLSSPPLDFSRWGGLEFYNGALYGHQGNGNTGFAKYTLTSNTWTVLPNVPGGAVLGAAIDPGTRTYYTYGSYSGNNWYTFDITTQSWSVGAIPFFQVDDGGMVFLPNLGLKGIYFVQGESGTGFASYEVLNSLAWLAIEPEHGITNPDAHSELTITLDASNLWGGTYQGTVMIKSNDPHSSSIDVPVTLHVTGAPDIYVSPETIAFGEHFVSADTVLKIENRGTDILSVENISVNSGVFTVNSESPFTLNPGQSKLLTVTFHTGTLGLFSGVLQITSNDSDESIIVIPLSGTAINPPIINLSTSSISADLFSGGIIEKPLSIQNKGEGFLNWHISLTASNESTNSLSVSEENDKSRYGNEGAIALGAGDFTTKRSSPDRITCVAASPQGMVYAQTQFGNSFYRYNPFDDSWTPLASSPVYQAYGGATHLNGKIYTISYYSSNSLAVYDSNSNSWSLISSDISGLAGITTDGTHVYLAGNNQFVRYTPETNTWTSLATSLLTDVFGLEYYNNHLYAHDYSGRFAKYSISTNSWVTLSSIPGFSVIGSAIDYYNGTYYAYGPYYGANLYSYSLQEETWSTTSIPLFSVGYGGMAYVHGNSVNGIYFAQGDIGTGFGRYETALSWLTISANSGATGANTQSDLAVILDATGLSPGDYEGTITIFSNDPQTSQVEVQVSLSVTRALSVNRASLQASASPGHEKTLDISLSNASSSALGWTVSVAGTSDLSSLLTRLNQNHTSISGVIPNRYNFLEGETGYQIIDGGDDMYDGGNMLSTNVNVSAYLYYSNKTITNDSKFGASGSYFTAKYPGLFVLAANTSINSFHINGDLGADGSGSVDGTVLTQTHNGKTYKGFVKRVYNAWDPSVNHLIIVEDNGTATHSYATYTNDDNHVVSNLAGVNRLYYLLFAGNSGAYIDNTAMQQIMTAFLEVSDQGKEWLKLNKYNGTLNGGGTETLDVTLSSMNLPVGVYETSLFFKENNSAKVQITVPVVFNVGLNQAPRVVTEIPDQLLTINENPLQLNLNHYFTDDDGESLTYSLEANSNVVFANITNNILTLTPNIIGEGTITIYGIDPAKEKASSTFTATVTTVTDINNPAHPVTLQNIPNPFADKTTIVYQLKSSGYVELIVQDVTGRIIQTWAEGDKLPGTYETLYNGEGIRAGLYFYKIVIQGQTIGIGRMVKH